MPGNLFGAARREGLRRQLDYLCVELAAERFVQLGYDGQLFLNVCPDTVYEDEQFAGHFISLLQQAGLDPKRCVLELTEDGLLDDYTVLKPKLQAVRTSGVEVAIDDLGAGSSGLRIWSELRPDYVKIDRYFVSDIDTDPMKVDFVRSIVDLAHSIRCRVIAEGVETEGECRRLVSLGIDSLQGHLFGRATEHLQARLEAVAELDKTGRSNRAPRASELAVRVPSIGSQTPIADVAELFHRMPGLGMLPVVDRDRPLGVVRREHLFGLLSRPFHLEVYNRRPVSAVMETAGVTVDGALRLEMVSRLLTSGKEARFMEEFVITDGGRYVGIGQIMELLRMISERQIVAARQANPLTALPGNGVTSAYVDQMLGERKRGVLCYVDLNYFKSYNDAYGYAQGDDVLLHLSGLLRGLVIDADEFVGHIGGDDFVVFLLQADWLPRLQALQRTFSKSVRRFYTAEHLVAGCIDSTDREGSRRSFPLLSIAVAALDTATMGCNDAEVAAHLLAEVKQRAKSRAGSSIVYRSGAGIVDCSTGMVEGDDPAQAAIA